MTTKMFDILSCEEFQKIIQAEEIVSHQSRAGSTGIRTAYAHIAEGIVGHEVDFARSSARAQR